MGTDIYGVPFATDRSVNPIIGQARAETQGQNATIGINFRSPESGNFDYFRSYYTTNEGAPGPYYAGGTGGKVRIRLYGADANGYPVGMQLDEIQWQPNLVGGCRFSSPCTVASDPSYQKTQWAPFDWPNNPALVAGDLYVITMENIDPLPAVNYVRLFMPDFYEYSADNSGGYSYLGVDEGYARQNFGMVYRLGTTWYPGNTWSAATDNRADPLPIFGAKLTNGKSFGQSGWMVGADHGFYHGSANPLGSGCTQNGFGDMPCNYGANVSPGEQFTPTTAMSASKVYIGLVPYTGGVVSLQVQSAAGAVLGSCPITTPTLDQTAANPYYGFVRSRTFSCTLPTPVTLSAGVTYKLRVVSTSGATGSVLLLGDATVWPFSSSPMGDMPGAAINGQFVAPNGGLVGIYDLQFGLKVASVIQPGMSALATTTVPAPATTVLGGPTVAIEPFASCLSNSFTWNATTSANASAVSVTVYWSSGAVHVADESDRWRIHESVRNRRLACRYLDERGDR